jgi:hypothetical protein
MARQIAPAAEKVRKRDGQEGRVRRFASIPVFS